MIDELFIFDDLDIVDVGITQYVECTLSKGIGKFASGTYINIIVIDEENSRIILETSEGKVAYKLSYHIGEEIDVSTASDG